MKIVEFRMPIPLNLSDFQRCSIHLLIDASTRQMESGSALEIFRNEKFKSNDTVGYYTEKRYHLAKNLPNWLQSILGTRLTILTEKSWNLYPKLFTKYFNEVFPTAEFSLQTDNLDNLTISENVLNLNLQDLNKRQVMLVDLTKFSKLKNYDPRYDVTKFKAGNFLPLKNDWFKNSDSSGMVSYKLLRLNLPYFGMLSSKIESYIVNFFYESLIYYTCMGLCSYDKWKDLTLDSLRVTEMECYDKLNDVFRNHYAKIIEKTIKLTPVHVEKGGEIPIPKEITPSTAISRSSSVEQKVSATPEKVETEAPVKEEVVGEEPSTDKKEEVATSAMAEVTTQRDSVRSATSTATYTPEKVSLEFSEDKVVVSSPGQELTPTNAEMAGPVPVPSFDEADFMDAVENLEDLEDSEEEKSVGLLDRVSSVLKFVKKSSFSDVSLVVKRRPSIDQATQVNLTQDTETLKTPSLDESHYEMDKRLLSSGSHEVGDTGTPEQFLTVDMGGKPGVKSTTAKIMSSVFEENASGEKPPQATVAEKTGVKRPVEKDKKDSFSYDIPITFTGYLYKLGRGFSCWTWNLRYIIVCGFNLYYFDRKNDMRPKDTISLKNSRISWAGSHMNRPFVFTITTQDKEVYYWSADEEESVKRWILLLQVLCEESPPYIVKQLAYELTYHQNNSQNVTDNINKF